METGRLVNELDITQQHFSRCISFNEGEMCVVMLYLHGCRFVCLYTSKLHLSFSISSFVFQHNWLQNNSTFLQFVDFSSYCCLWHFDTFSWLFLVQLSLNLSQWTTTQPTDCCFIGTYTTPSYSYVSLTNYLSWSMRIFVFDVYWQN